MKITEGPYKGYYTINSLESNESTFGSYLEMQRSLQQASGGRGLAWYKYSPGPGKDIQGFNQTYLPRIDDFYYVPLDPTIDIRKQLYALENKLVPADGNTERFNLELSKVHVPDNWCPYYIDPLPMSCVKETKPMNQPSESISEKILKFMLYVLVAFLLAFGFSYVSVYG